MQLAELRDYAGRRGWQIVDKFTDQGVSGCPRVPVVRSTRRHAGECSAPQVLARCSHGRLRSSRVSSDRGDVGPHSP